MRLFPNRTDAITDLHRQGFTDDFQLVGNDLLWVQENAIIRVGEFTIAECYEVEESIVFGIVALYHNIKGILIKRLENSNNIPPVIIKKLNELSLQKQSERITCYYEKNSLKPGW